MSKQNQVENKTSKLATREIREVQVEEAMKHISLACRLVGHNAVHQIVEEMAEEARAQRAYLMDTGGWS